MSGKPVNIVTVVLMKRTQLFIADADLNPYKGLHLYRMQISTWIYYVTLAKTIKIAEKCRDFLGGVWISMPPGLLVSDIVHYLPSGHGKYNSAFTWICCTIIEKF